MAPHRTLCLAVISVVLAACGAASQSSGAGSGGAALSGRAYDPMCNFKASAPHAYSSVIWIWFGDSDGSNVASNSGVTPYTGALMERCGLAVDYHNITHPYLPNALGATSGVVQGQAATADCAPAACPQPQQSIFDQLQADGRQWREFVLAPQGTCADGPAAYYTASQLAALSGRRRSALRRTASCAMSWSGGRLPTSPSSFRTSLTTRVRKPTSACTAVSRCGTPSAWA